MTLVYPFEHRHDAVPTELKHLLGGKGADLAEMTSVLGLPVPPGFTITTAACRSFLAGGGWPGGLDDEIATHLDRLEAKMGRRLGDPSDPLLVSVRSGAALSMPGMMDTVLNLGLNDDSVEGLAKQTGDDRFADHLYRRFIAMFGRIVLGLDARRFDELLDAARILAGVSAAAHPRRAAALPHDQLPDDRRNRDWSAVPAGPDRAGATGGGRGVHVLDRQHVWSCTATACTSPTTSAPW